MIPIMTSRSAALSHTKKNTLFLNESSSLSHIAQFGNGESCRNLWRLRDTERFLMNDLTLRCK